MKIFLYAVVSIPSGAPGMQSILSELSGMHGESLFSGFSQRYCCYCWACRCGGADSKRKGHCVCCCN